MFSYITSRAYILSEVINMATPPNPNRKLGKLKAKIDSRTFKFNNILDTTKLPPLPATYDVDTGYNATITQGMWGNDYWGDCVIAGRANFTLRCEYFEQKKVIGISEQECLNEYWSEQGGNATTKPDNGLVMLDSINLWRTKGWTAAGNKYDIYAFSAIDWNNHDELKYATMLLSGAYVGIEFPSTAMAQFDNNQTWTVVDGATIEGGHAIYIVGYNATGPVCITWGRKQQMDWQFFDAYVDEAYAIVDNANTFTANSPVDIVKLTALLNNIQGTQTIFTAVIDPDGVITENNIEVGANNTFTVNFTPTKKGVYTISAQYLTVSKEYKVTVL